MKHNKKELLLFVCTACTVLLQNEGRKKEFGLTEAQAERLKKILAQPETVRGIMVLFQALNAALIPAKRSLQQTAENYPLEYLELSARPYTCLSRSMLFGEIRTVADLFGYPIARLAELEGSGLTPRD